MFIFGNARKWILFSDNGKRQPSFFLPKTLNSIHHGTTNQFVLACRNAMCSVRGQRRLPADPEFSSIRLEIHGMFPMFVMLNVFDFGDCIAPF